MVQASDTSGIDWTNLSSQFAQRIEKMYGPSNMSQKRLRSGQDKQVLPPPKKIKKEQECTLSELSLPPIKLYDRVVTVQVGKKRKEFQVHRGVLCHRSTIFQKAFQGEFRQLIANLISLPDIEPDVFEAVYEWLYSCRLPQSPIGQAEAKLHIWNAYSLFLRLWIFAEGRGMPALQDAAINQLISLWIYTSSFPSRSLVQMVYDGTTHDCPVRRLLVDIMVYSGHTPKAFEGDYSIATAPKPWSADFTRDVLVKFARVPCGQHAKTMTAEEWQYADKCKYHVHGYHPG